MHYTAGVGAVGSFVGARSVPGDGFLPTLARVLLDGAGALFGLYLLLALGLAVYGALLRRFPAAGGTAPARTREQVNEAWDDYLGWSR